MHKEKLTLPSIKKDLMIVFNLQVSHKTDWRLAYILPITLLAVILGALAQSAWLGLLIFSTCIYQIVCFIKDQKEFHAKKKAVLNATERKEFSISLQKFSHIAEESVYEPHFQSKHAHSQKIILVYYFEGGASWRIPNIGTHYLWSEHFYLSTQGMENLATKGSEFFFVRLQEHQEIAYIYPCKLFELEESLAQSFL